VGQAYEAQTESHPRPRPRDSEREDPLVSPVADEQPPRDLGADLAGAATTPASTDSGADGRRRLLVIGVTVVLLIFLFVLATRAFH
jgi:hypothetical protein